MNGAALSAAWTTFKESIYWHNPQWTPTNKKFAGYADSNDAEAARVDTWVRALTAGQSLPAPTVASKHGLGIIGTVNALLAGYAGTVVVGPAGGTYHGTLEVKPTSVLGATKVEISVDGTVRTIIASSGSWQLDTTKLSDGAHRLSYRFLDDNGAEVGRSGQVPLAVKNGV